MKIDGNYKGNFQLDTCLICHYACVVSDCSSFSFKSGAQNNFTAHYTFLMQQKCQNGGIYYAHDSLYNLSQLYFQIKTNFFSDKQQHQQRENVSKHFPIQTAKKSQSAAYLKPLFFHHEHSEFLHDGTMHDAPPHNLIPSYKPLN